MRSVLVLVWMMVVVCVAGCANLDAGAPRGARPTASDEVANGLTAEPSANPLAGAFYNEGKESDIRARTETYDRSAVTSAASVNTGPPGVDGEMQAALERARQADRMLIHRGLVRVEVARPDEVGREFVAKVTAWGGYLTIQHGAEWTLRVPATRFEEAFAAAKALGRVLDESRQANDVTEEFFDLGLRLDTAKKARDRLLDVLQRAEKVEDVLKVEAELRRLTEEIERMEGRRKVLADQVALATLQLALQAPSQPPPGRRVRGASRFEWVGRVGAEAMMEGF